MSDVTTHRNAYRRIGSFGKNGLLNRSSPASSNWDKMISDFGIILLRAKTLVRVRHIFLLVVVPIAKGMQQIR